MHKRVCSEDPSIKPHVPIEMAVERVLKRLPSQETAPAGATCYICLDHNSKLVRGCACRGDSAGFVHLDCLIQFAERNAKDSMSQSFQSCMNCKQAFTGALQLQLARRMWRRHRDESVESKLLLESCNLLGVLLGLNDEEDAEKCVTDVLLNSLHIDNGPHKLKVASRMAKEWPEEALKLIEEVVSQVKQDGDIDLKFRAQNQYMQEAQRLGRFEETVAMATECLEYAKTYCGDSSDPYLIERKHTALNMFAASCGMTGRFDESKRTFDELIVSATRIYGREHENTRQYFFDRAVCLSKMVQKAQDLVNRDDLANGARYLDAVLIESKARDFFDAKDPNVQINCETMAGAAAVLGMLGRLQESVALARLCLKSAREQKDVDSELTQQCMFNYAWALYELNRLKESKEVLDELLAIQTRLYGPDGPPTRKTGDFLTRLN